jgi:hypothetical protein
MTQCEAITNGDTRCPDQATAIVHRDGYQPAALCRYHARAVINEAAALGELAVAVPIENEDEEQGS